MLPRVVAKKAGVVGAPNRIVAVSVTERQRRQVTEHVLGDRQVIGSGIEVAFFAAGHTDGQHRVATQVITRQGILRTLLGIRTGRRDHIDRRGADHVDVVIGRE